MNDLPVAVFGGRLRPKPRRLFRELKVRFQGKRNYPFIELWRLRDMHVAAQRVRSA